MAVEPPVIPTVGRLRPEDFKFKAATVGTLLLNTDPTLSVVSEGDLV